MKTSHLSATTAATIVMCAAISTHSFAAPPVVPATIPSIPVGVMTAFPTVVQTGTKPTLTWSILYPSKLSDIVTINPPGTLIPNQPAYVTVQIVGTGVSSCDSHDNEKRHADARVSVNGGAYEQIYYGSEEETEEDDPDHSDHCGPSKQLYIKKLAANQCLDFGGRYVTNSRWSPFYTTRSSNQQCVALRNGDTPPTAFPLYGSSKCKNYLKPYLDASGKVRLGPLSVLILMELGQTNHSMECFDYQDEVLLVTFSTKHPNNGHGNNLDGVDSSNPGRGCGGPNGADDPSGGIDDESR